jgi:hypothetical protein
MAEKHCHRGPDLEGCDDDSLDVHTVTATGVLDHPAIVNKSDNGVNAGHDVLIDDDPAGSITTDRGFAFHGQDDDPLVANAHAQ